MRRSRQTEVMTKDDWSTHNGQSNRRDREPSSPSRATPYSRWTWCDRSPGGAPTHQAPRGKPMHYKLWSTYVRYKYLLSMRPPRVHTNCRERRLSLTTDATILRRREPPQSRKHSRWSEYAARSRGEPPPMQANDERFSFFVLLSQPFQRLLAHQLVFSPPSTQPSLQEPTCE